MSDNTIQAQVDFKSLTTDVFSQTYIDLFKKTSKFHSNCLHRIIYNVTYQYLNSPFLGLLKHDSK